MATFEPQLQAQEHTCHKGCHKSFLWFFHTFAPQEDRHFLLRFPQFLDTKWLQAWPLARLRSPFLAKNHPLPWLWAIPKVHQFYHVPFMFHGMTEETKSSWNNSTTRVHPQKSSTAAGCHVSHDSAIDDEPRDELRKIQRIICIRLWASTPLASRGYCRAMPRVGQPQAQFGCADVQGHEVLVFPLETFQQPLFNGISPYISLI